MFLYSTVSTLKPGQVRISCRPTWSTGSIVDASESRWNSRNVRTNCRNRGDDLTQLQLVQDSGLSGSVETDHQNTHLLLAPQAVEQLRERETHLGGRVSVLSEGSGVVV